MAHAIHQGSVYFASINVRFQATLYMQSVLKVLEVFHSRSSV